MFGVEAGRIVEYNMFIFTWRVFCFELERRFICSPSRAMHILKILPAANCSIFASSILGIQRALVAAQFSRLNFCHPLRHQNTPRSSLAQVLQKSNFGMTSHFQQHQSRIVAMEKKTLTPFQCNFCCSLKRLLRRMPTQPTHFESKF